jgi:hypothetical protein
MKLPTSLAVSTIGVPLPLCFSSRSERQSVTLGSISVHQSMRGSEFGPKSEQMMEDLIAAIRKVRG